MANFQSLAESLESQSVETLALKYKLANPVKSVAAIGNGMRNGFFFLAGTKSTKKDPSPTSRKTIRMPHRLRWGGMSDLGGGLDAHPQDAVESVLGFQVLKAPPLAAG